MIFLPGRALSIVLFFFSSRRRHTRLQGDWSSDVCSSDLFPGGKEQLIEEATRYGGDVVVKLLTEAIEQHDPAAAVDSVGGFWRTVLYDRSEERRVGKECRSRGSPYH